MLKISICIVLISYIFYYSMSNFKSIHTIHSSINKSISKISHIHGNVFNFDLLQIASDNFRYPILVKDLMNVKNNSNFFKWKERDYIIDIIRNINITIDDTISSSCLNNETIFEEIILINNIMKIYNNIENDKDKDNNNNNNNNNTKINISSNDEINNLLRDDLINNTMWNGFATPAHKTYLGGNLLLNHGNINLDTSTKDIVLKQIKINSSNIKWKSSFFTQYYFQILGSQRIWFIDYNKHSYLVDSMDSYKTDSQFIINSICNMSKLINHSPIQYIDIKEGDVLFIPSWYLYTLDYDVNSCPHHNQIKNDNNNETNNDNMININNELKVGVILKECNITLSFRNNFQLSTTVVLKELTKQLGIHTLINEIKNYKFWK